MALNVMGPKEIKQEIVDIEVVKLVKKSTSSEKNVCTSDSIPLQTRMALTSCKVYFTPFEKALILNLARPYLEVIENKETNGVISAEKVKAFREITKQFNDTDRVNPRTEKQIRQCYNNLKKKLRSKPTCLRQQQRKTDGGNAVEEANLSSLEYQFLSHPILLLSSDSDTSGMEISKSQDKSTSTADPVCLLTSSNNASNKVPELDILMEVPKIEHDKSTSTADLNCSLSPSNGAFMEAPELNTSIKAPKIVHVKSTSADIVCPLTPSNITFFEASELDTSMKAPKIVQVKSTSTADLLCPLTPSNSASIKAPELDTSDIKASKTESQDKSTSTADPVCLLTPSNSASNKVPELDILSINCLDDEEMPLNDQSLESETPEPVSVPVEASGVKSSKGNSLLETLMTFRKNSKKQTAPSAAARAAACIEAEHIQKTKYMQKEEERKEQQAEADRKEQELRMEHLKEKIRLTKTKTLIHEKFLELMDTNPECINMLQNVLSGE